MNILGISCFYHDAAAAYNVYDLLVQTQFFRHYDWVTEPAEGPESSFLCDLCVLCGKVVK